MLALYGVTELAYAPTRQTRQCTEPALRVRQHLSGEGAALPSAIESERAKLDVFCRTVVVPWRPAARGSAAKCGERSCPSYCRGNANTCRGHERSSDQGDNAAESPTTTTGSSRTPKPGQGNKLVIAPHAASRPPWSVEEQSACFVVGDPDGKQPRISLFRG
jgi:hypothetical protein